jgi:putative spermidine/putrescine transport system substrate-binding protein
LTVEPPVPVKRPVRSRRCISRRRALSMMSAAGLAGLTACGYDDEGNRTPSETPKPRETAELEPTATQDTIGSPVAGYSDPTRWEGRTLTVGTWGGDYQDAQKAAFFDPFTAATGASVQDKVADLDGLRSQVDSQEVVWDTLTVPMEQMIRLARDGYLEPLNYGFIDPTPLYADIVLEYGVGAAYFSTTIIYPADSTGVPQSWVDLWNVAPIPEGGEPDPSQLRCLRSYPIGTLEFALIADGVEPAMLYPLDVDRAFASLNRIRDNVLVWWQESKEPIELVAVGEVGLANAWNVRIHQLDLADEVRIQWYQGMLSADAWVVPRGSPNQDLAFDFINFATRAVPNANFARLVPYGPVNRESFDLIRDDRLPVLPSSPTNKPVQFVQDWGYWAEYEQPLTERFEQWLLESDSEATPED